MSLVAYDSSGSDDDESDTSGDAKCNNTKLTLPVKQRETVKITIPSLDQFKDDEDQTEQKRKIPQFKSGSGLFSVLPPPKYTTDSSSFKPHILTKKKIPPKKSLPLPTSSTKTVPTKEHTPTTVPKLNLVDTEETSDKEEDSEEHIDFFSLDSNHEIVQDTLPPELSTSSSTLFQALPKPAQKPESSSILSDIPEGPVVPVLTGTDDTPYTDDDDGMDYAAACEEFAQQQADTSYQGPSGSSNPSILEDEGFQKLKGRRREKDAIEFIDVNADDQMTGKEEWLLQSLTQERSQRSLKRRHDMPSGQQRRKHQITYLAFQAKERELDLKNNWAANSQTRRQTQAKYGF